MISNKNTLIAASLAAIGASACCLGPLLLLSLGISGTWIGSLTSMEPYSPIFSAVTIILIAIVFYHLYISTPKCKEGELCSDKSVIRKQRMIFWVVSCILLLVISFQYYAEYIIS